MSVRRALPLTWFLGALVASGCDRTSPGWTDAERRQIAGLSLSVLADPPPDRGNEVSGSADAVALGQRLFFDPKLSADGSVSCASCHRPDQHFADRQARSRGLGTTRRHAPSLVAAAWSPWQFWDGRADSLWSQAIGPLTHPDEMGLDAPGLAAALDRHHAGELERLFGGPAADADAQLVRVAKVIAAFVRSMRPGTSRFDRFADALADDDAGAVDRLSAVEQRGLRLFLGRAQCVRCHHGPLFTDQDFHNTGLAPRSGDPPDEGRRTGARRFRNSPHRCGGDPAGPCPQLRHLRPGLNRAFKTPSLRNVGETAPYMHDGRFTSLRQVLEHYNRAAPVHSAHGHSDLFALGLNDDDLAAIEAFLHTLTGPDTVGIRPAP